MSKRKVERFLRELSELTVKHGIVIEGSCPIPAAVSKLNLQDVPGRYKSLKAKDGLMFHWVGKFSE